MTLREVRAEGADRIAEDEVAVLRDRLAEQGFEPAKPRDLTTLEDVAEATGVSVEEVRQLLSRMRAEEAFRERRGKRISVLAFVGAVALLVGVTVTWIRLHPQDGESLPVPTFRPAPTPPPVVTRTVPVLPSPPMYSMGDQVGAPPPGIQVEIVGQHSAAEGNGYSPEIPRMDYQVERDQIARSIETLANKTLEYDRMNSAVQGPFRDMAGNRVEPTPGKAYYSISGWPGTTSGWLSFPITESGQTELVRIAESVLEDAKKAQDAALERNGRPDAEGVVGPPPGFKVTFGGRRMDVQQGPRWAFAPIDPSSVVERLADCIANARRRDSALPKGPWRSSARSESKVSTPKRYRAQVEGPYGTFEIDLPADDGAFAAALRRKLAPAAAQVERGNSLARRTPTDGEPRTDNR